VTRAGLGSVRQLAFSVKAFYLRRGAAELAGRGAGGGRAPAAAQALTADGRSAKPLNFVSLLFLRRRIRLLE